MQTNDILERLDNLLDDVDECIQQLPLKAERKKQLASLVYELWMQVEDDVSKSMPIQRSSTKLQSIQLSARRIGTMVR